MTNDSHTIVSSIFDALPPTVMERLKKTDVYLRFMLERAKLEALAANTLAKMGKLTDPELLGQESTVLKLGEAVLEEINTLQFMLDEPCCADFQKHNRTAPASALSTKDAAAKRQKTIL